MPSLCTWPTFEEAFSKDYKVSPLFLVLPAGHSPLSEWYKSFPAHQELARVQSSDAPGTHSQCHSAKQEQQRQKHYLVTKTFTLLFFFIKHKSFSF